MNAEKPIMSQLPEMKLPDTQAVQAAASDTMNNVSNSIANVQGSINNTLNEFSSKSVVGASQEFLTSNSIIAKFVFIILVLIAFMFFINLGIRFLGYVTTAQTNPYLVYGMIPGNLPQHITQDPKNTNSETVLRSNNQGTGLEFTWSMWLLVTGNNTNVTYQHIFNKGNNVYDSTSGIATINNGPGVYLGNGSNGSTNLHIVMDNNSNPGANGYNPTTVDISGVPLNKWFHVAIRMENIMLDTYINGTIANRTQLTTVPNQNYYDIFACQNGGFVGNLSNLRYYPSAISVFDINNIVIGGPNTSLSSIISNATSSAYPYYFSNMWYTNKL